MFNCDNIHGYRVNDFDIFVGAACLLAGLIIAAIDLIFPHQFSTILEVDYDTPYDRHVIIEESFDTRNIRRKVPKIEDSLGDRIMRSALRYNIIHVFSVTKLCFQHCTTFYIILKMFQPIIVQTSK